MSADDNDFSGCTSIHSMHGVSGILIHNDPHIYIYM